MPTPSKTEVTTRVGETTGWPILMWMNWLNIGSSQLDNAGPEKVTQQQTDCGTDQPLQQAFDQDHTGDGAAFGAQGAQHADIAPAFGHHGAEGIENDEPAHEQRQYTKHIEGCLAQFETGEHFRAGLDGTDLIIAPQG